MFNGNKELDIKELKKEWSQFFYKNRINYEALRLIGVNEQYIKNIRMQLCYLGPIGGVIGPSSLTFNKSILERIEKDLQQILKDKADLTKFGVDLHKIIIEKDLEFAYVAELAEMDPSYLYKIINEKRVPSRDQAIKIAVVLGLNLNETNELLSKLGYLLYGGSKRDTIISFCIERGVKLFDIDILLSENDEKVLTKAS